MTATIWRCWIHGGRSDDRAKDCDRRLIPDFQGVNCAFVPARDSGSTPEQGSTR